MESKMVILLYVIGVVLCFLMSRYAFRYTCKKYGWEYLWFDAFIVIAMSFTSYIGFLIMFLIHLSEKDLFKKFSFKTKEPPKWL
jgi:hypothetical protein